MSIERILPAVAGVLKGITPPSGHKRPHVHEYPPDSISEVPAFVIFPKTRRMPWPRPPNSRENSRELSILLLFPSQEAATDVRMAAPWEQLVIAAFDQHFGLGGKVNACGVSESTGPTHVEYGEESYRGYIFTLKIEDQETVIYQG